MPSICQIIIIRITVEFFSKIFYVHFLNLKSNLSNIEKYKAIFHKSILARYFLSNHSLRKLFLSSYSSRYLLSKKFFSQIFTVESKWEYFCLIIQLFSVKLHLKKISDKFWPRKSLLNISVQLCIKNTSVELIRYFYWGPLWH